MWGWQKVAAQETYDAAEFLVAEARKQGITNDDLIFDPGIAPIGTDGDGNLVRLLNAMKMIHSDSD